MGSTFVCCLSRRERLQCLLFGKFNPRFCVSSRLGLLSLHLFLSQQVTDNWGGFEDRPVKARERLGLRPAHSAGLESVPGILCISSAHI